MPLAGLVYFNFGLYNFSSFATSKCENFFCYSFFVMKERHPRILDTFNLHQIWIQFWDLAVKLKQIAHKETYRQTRQQSRTIELIHYLDDTYNLLSKNHRLEHDRFQSLYTPLTRITLNPNRDGKMDSHAVELFYDSQSITSLVNAMLKEVWMSMF